MSSQDRRRFVSVRPHELAASDNLKENYTNVLRLCVYSMSYGWWPRTTSKRTTPMYYVCYELRLAASDNLKENYTTVVIHVKDVNDNPPVFERPTYRTQITEEDDRNLPKRVLQVPRP
uniref:Cadherin domain-containing protein n=1 Tax=Timema tahoe TaxID=61484 RepID=A0A7R9FKR1_9NEOP|nr:unnamed protein product [Timema tahoe]